MWVGTTGENFSISKLSRTMCGLCREELLSHERFVVCQYDRHALCMKNIISTHVLSETQDLYRRAKVWILAGSFWHAMHATQQLKW